MANTTNRILDLILEAGRTATRKDLAYHMVNCSAEAVEHDLAGLWKWGGGPKLLAISGVASLNPKSDFFAAWRGLIRSVPLAGRAERLSGGRGGREWETLRKAGPDLRALWLPLPGTDLGLALERGGRDFSDIELDDLAKLAEGYALAWRALAPAGGRRWGWFGLILVLAMAAALYWVRVPVRVSAPCEVVARAPYAVTAPAAGIVEAVTVEPGQRVTAGETVAVYEEAAAVPGQPGKRLKIVAGSTGVVQMDKPGQWRGRAAAAGETIMRLADPLDGRLRIWLRPEDGFEFDRARPVSVRLDAYGDTTREAKLISVDAEARTDPDGVKAFPADAEWLDRDSSPPPLGSTGEATLYGPEARLGDWLWRMLTRR